MADLTITAANVVAGSTANLETAIAAVAVTAGQAVYKEASTGKFKLSDANSATAEVRAVYGIAENNAAAGQHLTVVKSGPITIGATVVVGAGYYLSATPGGVAPVADMLSGLYPTLIGFATTAAIINVDITAAGVAVP
jgi:hypothetical protein